MNPRPFIIFALPRSRTAWLSQWLSYGGRLVGHDIGIDCGSVQQFLDPLWSRQLAGTVETGAMMAGRILRHAMPSAVFITIRRPVSEVIASLAAHGVSGVDEEIERRDALLDEIERGCGGERVHFGNLANPACLAALFQRCLGVRHDPIWTDALCRRNIQVDVVAELQRVAQRAEPIAAIKADVAALTAKIGDPMTPPLVHIGLERWQAFWPEFERIGPLHYAEVGSDLRSGPAYSMDAEFMASMDAAGVLKIMSARINECLVGYCMWTITRDAERGGIPLADQGPWYVSPEVPRNLQLGRRLLDESIKLIRAMGIENVELHHNTAGRGARAGALYRRMGAVEYQHRYSLHLGSEQCQA